MDVDQVVEAELVAEAVGTAEGLGGEPGEVVDVRGDPLPEDRPQDGVRQGALGCSRRCRPSSPPACS
jgi:hypothetical protein